MIRKISNSKQSRVCRIVRNAGYCPVLCMKCGGCFMPQSQWSLSIAECKRMCHRPDRVMSELIRLTKGGV